MPLVHVVDFLDRRGGIGMGELLGSTAETAGEEVLVGHVMRAAAELAGVPYLAVRLSIPAMMVNPLHWKLVKTVSFVNMSPCIREQR